MFEQTTILGPGLLGASLAMAAKERGLTHRVAAWSRSSSTRAKCRGAGWCDRVAESPAEAVAGGDFVVLCTPVATIVPLLREVAPGLAPGALVTDVGSTKGGIVRQAATLSGKDFNFVGSHPMAGSERTGMEHARATLFEGAICFVTPLAHTAEAPVARIAAFWEALGMSVSRVDPDLHDRIVAQVSHLPHLLASTLCAHLAARDPEWGRFSGSGLRDTTRVAAGDPALWRQIFAENRTAVREALDGFGDALASFRRALEEEDDEEVERLLETGKRFRDAL